MPSDEKISAQCEDLALEIRQDLEAAIASNNNNLQALLKKYPNAAQESDKTPFEIGDIAKDGIDIVKDIEIEYDDWIEQSEESEWTIRTLKLWFFMQKGFADSNPWAQWPQIFDDKSFMN